MTAAEAKRNTLAAVARAQRNAERAYKVQQTKEKIEQKTQKEYVRQNFSRWFKNDFGKQIEEAVRNGETRTRVRISSYSGPEALAYPVHATVAALTLYLTKRGFKVPTWTAIHKIGVNLDCPQFGGYEYAELEVSWDVAV